MALAPVQALPLDRIDLSEPEFWLRPEEEREGAFLTLREERPVAFFPERAFPGLPVGPGYWAVTRYEDAWRVSRDPKTFCSGRGVNIGDLPIEISEFFGSMIAMDDPRHARLRLIIQKAFTPKQVADVEQQVRDKARQIVDAVAEKGGCDFVAEIAAPLPLEVICDMLSIPQADRPRMFELTNVILGAGDPEYGGTLEALILAGQEMYQYASALGEDRLANPGDDLVSMLMHAEVDGQRISTQEFGSFIILLVVAGNETTRNAISWGMKALTDHPDQRRAWVQDPSVTPTAVEEIVRWASPVIHFRRTATRDTVVGGQPVAEGEKVVVWYNSANRDASRFVDPFTFDVRRTPNDQVGFGAGGPHFCLGANLARREIAVMFDELFRRLPDLEITGEPDRLMSHFIHGIKRMPCEFTPTRGA